MWCKQPSHGDCIGLEELEQGVTFEAADAGTFTLTTLDGTRLLRDRGTIKFLGIFDTLGDGQPGGILISEELLAVHGPHADDCTFCGTFLGALT